MISDTGRWGAVFAALLVVAALSAHPAPAKGGEDNRPIVLELFTSQGCSACPAADKLLRDIAATRDDVIALSFHVDYWDYFGWADRFATSETTARQQAYADMFGVSYVYTPQIVLDGTHELLGSDRDAVVAAIERAREEARPRVPVRMAHMETGGLGVELGAADYEGKAAVWLVVFDRRHVTDVNAGENGGRRLVNYHVVRKHRRIGTWSGDAIALEIYPEGDPQPGLVSMDYGCAVLVQEEGGVGRIIGSHAIWADDTPL